MNPPFVDPWRANRWLRKVGTGLALAASFGVGMATGLGLVAVAFGRDLFERLPRFVPAPGQE